MVAPDVRHPISLCLSKDGDARFLGHLDFGRLVTRALRRSRLPVLYTQGFNPRIKLAFAEALPVGVASQGEWISLFLTEVVSPDEIRARLAPALPQGVAVVAVRRGKPPAAATPQRYRLDVTDGATAAADALTDLLERDEYLVDDPRRDRSFDLRAALASGWSHDDHLLVDLVAVDGKTPRPAAVARALEALASEAGREVPVFGVFTKVVPVERGPGDTSSWPVAATRAAPPASSSSTPPSPRRAALRF